jgi:hypothetical protein
MRKLFTLVLCISFFIICLVGCQSSAQKPAVPDQKPKVTDKNTTDEMTASERRVLANRLSKLAESVDGVERASVVISSIGMTNNDLINMDGGNKNNDANNNLNSTNPNSKMNTDPNNNNLSNRMNNNTNNNNMNNNNMNNNTNNNNNTVSGQMVMVGLTLEPSAMRDPATENKIKNTVANKLKASDRRISQVLVTTDPNLIKRINDVAAGIIEGKPIQNFRDDINDITNKVRNQGPAF